MADPSTTQSNEPKSTDPQITSLSNQPNYNSSIPVWIDENTGKQVDVYDPQTRIYNTAIQNRYYSNITDQNNNSIFIDPNTYYYYSGPDPNYQMDSSLTQYLHIKDPQYVNRIYQEYPLPRFIMLSNNYIQGTLNPKTTQPEPTYQQYPKITIINQALSENANNLNTQRYTIIDTQDTLNTLTNRLNTLKLKLNTLKQKPLYSAGGTLTFY